MRTINWSSEFKKDYRRIKKNSHYSNKDVEQLLETVAELLSKGEPLPENCRDHLLSGNWKGYRECHLKPDLLLIYKTEGQDTLRFARIGSHSKLFK